MKELEDENEVHKSHKPEVLKWDSEYFESIKDTEPIAAFGPVSESIRQSFPEKQACSIGCHGSDCKYCNPTGPKAPWSDEDRVIKGLYCNWVTDNILATSRPTTRAMKEFDIIQQFQDAGIRSIINLQQPGEHEGCGFGNEPDGFSYNSKDFMDANIFFYNFGWKDYGIGSMKNILDMVKVMQFAISEGKVAVHCHAGLGRTGVLIGAYLIYANRIPANQAVLYIRTRRKKSIQTSSQIQCLRDFEEYLKPLLVIFSNVPAEEDDTSLPNEERDFILRQFMIRQSAILHGQEGRRLKNIPKIVYACCQRLLELAGRGHRHEFHDRFKDIRATAPKAFINENMDSNNRSPSRASIDVSQSMQLPLHMSSGRLRHRESFTALSITKATKNKLAMSTSQSFNGHDPTGTRSTWREGKSLELSNSSDKAHFVTECMAMAYNEYTPEHLEEIKKYKELLNTDSNAYQTLFEEKNPVVVAGLMWTWLDALREPVLDAQDLPVMLQHDSVQEGLAHIHKASRGTIETAFLTIAHLLPISDGHLHDDLYCRALSTLTHQNMFLDMDYLVASTGSSAASSLTLSRTSNASGLMRGHLAERLMSFFCTLTRNYDDRLQQAHQRRLASKSNVANGAKSPPRSSAKQDVLENEQQGDLIEDMAEC